MPNPIRISVVSVLALLFAIGAVAPAIADPPDWAPAHGYRDHHRDREREHDYRRHRDRDSDHYRDREPWHREDEAGPVPFGISLGRCNREQLGQVLGGLAGAAIGSTAQGRDRPVAIIGGAILGALIGGQIGHHMDEVDEYCIGQTLEYARAGQTITWNNPDNGAVYKVTPQAAVRMPSGQYCREYQTTIMIDGRKRRAYGKACRQPDGTWKKAD